MKKITLKIVALILISAYLSSCIKEVKINDNFDFDLIANFSENGFIYEKEDLSLSIVQDRIVKTNKYYFSFELSQGEGYFEKVDGEMITSLQENRVTILRNEVLHYIPQEIGEHTIKVIVTDSYGNFKIKTFTFNVDFALFTLLYTTATNTYPINQKSPTNLTYLQEDQETYIFEYYVTEGTGMLWLEDQELQPDTEIEMEVGSKTLMYLPETLEEHTIHIKATSSDGGERETELLINVTNVDFNIEATPQGQSVNLNENLPITISLNTSDASDQILYKIKYEYEDGSNIGILKNQDGEEKAPGDFWDLIPGTYEFLFKSENEGATTIKFIAEDSNEQEKEDSVIFDVENVPFIFTGSTVTNLNYINDITGLNFTLAPDGDTELITYKVSYSQSVGNGILELSNGTVLEPNNLLDVEPGSFSFNFIPQSLGDHSLLFTVVDSNGLENEVLIELTATHVPVTFVVNGIDTMILGENSTVNFIITPQRENGTTYKMNYILTGGQGVLRDNSNTEISPGEYRDVNIGNFSYTYNATTQGNHNLRFQLKDNNDQIIERDIYIIVTNNVFTFSADAEDNTILVNNTTNINCNLNVNITGNTNYYLTMTKTGANSNLSLNGNNISPGVELEFSPGTFILLHEPLEIGTTQYTLMMRDDLGNEVIREINIEAGQLDFSLNVTLPQYVFINQENTFIFALVPTGTYDGITYQMSYDVQNPQLGNFDNQTEAVPFNVIPVSFEMNYTPTTLGIHEVTFTVLDSNNQSHDYTETFEVVAADFTWVVNQSNSTILYNTSDNISAILNQVVTNPNVTYSISYTISGGPGELLDDNGLTLQQGAILPDNYNYTFKASQTGNYSINLIITDSNGISHNVILNYIVVHTDFNMYCSSLADMNNNTIQDFNINLTQNLDDTNIQYEVKFNVVSSSTGNGNITDQNNNTISGWQTINVGTNDYKFVANTFGGVELLTEIREQGNNATIKSCTTNFDINDVNVDFTCNMVNNTLILDQIESIEFNVVETPTTSDNYELKYEIINPTGTIKNGINIVSANSYFPIVANNPFYLTYTGNIVGNTTILWTVKNLTTEQTYTCNSTITVNAYPPCDFSISGGAVTSTAEVNDDVTVNFLFNEIADQGQPCNTNYKFSFTTTGNGTFTYNGQTKQANQEFDFNPNVNFGTYNGTSEGLHNLEFNFRNTYGSPTTHSFNTDVTFNATDFTWTATQSNSTIMINGSDNVFAVLSQAITNPSVTYQLQVNINGPGELLDSNNNPVTSGAIVTGNFNWHFTSNQTGNTSIILTVTDSFTISHSVTLNYTTNHTEFSMYCSNLADMYVNGEQEFNTDVSQLITDNTINYEIKYSFSGSGSGGVFDLNNNSINSSWHAISSLGIQDAKFKATAQGVINLLIQVREQGLDNTIQSCQSDFTINPFTVTFTGSTQNTSINLNDDTNINFNITEVPNLNHSYTLSYNYTNGSGLLAQYNGGNVLATTSPIGVSIGNNTWNFTGTQVGNVSIHFVLTDVNTGQTYTLNNDIDITVNQIDNCIPLINAQMLATSAYIGEEKNVNLTFNTSTIDICNANYEMYFTLPNGLNGEFTLNNVSKLVNQNFNNINLQTITGTYKGLNTGNHNITFHFVNTLSGVEDTANVQITINDCSYQISGGFLSNGGNINTDVSMLFDFTEYGFNCNDNYRFRFLTSGGNGNTFTYNNATKSDNLWFNYDPTISNGFYTGVNSGNHNVTFQFENINTGVVISFSDNISFNLPGFSLTCTGGGSDEIPFEISINQESNFYNIINQDIINNNLKYDFRYTFIQGNGEIYKLDNTPINIGDWTGVQSNINADTYIRKFKATVSGNVTIKTELRRHNDNSTIKYCITKFVVLNENCDYIFNDAQEENGIVPINTLTEISISITEQNSGNCNTNYMFYYTTKLNGVSTNLGHLVYLGNIKQQNQVNSFEILPGVIPVYFTTTDPGDYEITFYTYNPNASIPTTSKTIFITFISPTISVSLTNSNDTVNVLDTANYAINISGGGSGNSSIYIRHDGNNLNSTLKVNNTIKSFFSNITVNDNFTIDLIPNEIGNNVPFYIDIIKNGISYTYTIYLTSTIPQFTISSVPQELEIWEDEIGNVDINVITSYNHNIDYTYSIYDSNNNGIPETYNGNPPNTKTLSVDPANLDINIFNDLNYSIKVENEYGHIEIINNISLHLKSILPTADGLSINTNNNIQNQTLVNNTIVKVKYNNNLDISLNNIIEGKYNITHYNLILKWYEEIYSTGLISERIETVNNIAYNPNNILQNFGSTDNFLLAPNGENKYVALIGSQNEEIQTNDYRWTSEIDELENNLPKLIRNLDYLIPGYIPTITIELVDTEGNIKTIIINLDNGWGYYNINN